MKRVIVAFVFGLVGLFAVSTFFSCGKGSEEENLPVEEVLPLPEEEVMPLHEGKGGAAPDELGAQEKETKRGT